VGGGGGGGWGWGGGGVGGWGGGGGGVEARIEVLVNVDGGCMWVCVSLCDGAGVCMRACSEFRVFALLSALLGFGGAATAASRRGDTLLCTIHADIWKYRHWSCSCCSVLQCVAVCCSVLQCVAVCCSVTQCDLGMLRLRQAEGVTRCCAQYIWTYGNTDVVMLQCVVVCSSV